MSKTQVTLTIDKDTKEKFQHIAKKLGSNMSTLTNMYYNSVIQSWKVEFQFDDEPVEIGFIPWEEMKEDEKEAYERIQKADISTFINI